MFVEKSISAPISLQRKPDWRPAYRLPPQMSDLSVGAELDRLTSFPHAVTEVDFLEMVEKLLVKTLQLIKQLPAKHHTATRLKSDVSLCPTNPCRVGIRGECF